MTVVREVGNTLNASTAGAILNRGLVSRPPCDLCRPCGLCRP
jgi:hypothetical protein